MNADGDFAALHLRRICRRLCLKDYVIIYMFSILSKISGISKLVNYFESKTFPNEEEIFKSYPVMFIPWSSIKETKKARLYEGKDMPYSITGN